MKTTAHNPKYNTRITSVATNAVIVGRGDWRRVKKEAKHLTPEQRKQIALNDEKTKQEQLLQITKKRENLIDTQTKPEVITRNLQTLNTFEERDYALQIADTKADEDLDEVKKINSEMVAAKARTFRDQQLEIHRQMKEDEKAEERSIADMLEENRQRAKSHYDEREASLKEQRRRGRAIIELQIEEHKINSILEAERRDREAKALAIQNEQIRQEDERIRAEQKARQQAFLHDCIAMEEALVKRKAEEKRQEQELAQMTIDYANEKALKEEARERQILAQKRLKEREIQEIRSKQQRAIDTKAIRDEMMAQRVQEEQARAAAEKEEAEQMAKITAVMKLKKDRADMINSKKLDQLEQQARERREYEMMLEQAETKKQKALADYTAKIEADQKYREELKQTVELRELSRKIDPDAKNREKAKMQAEQDAYMQRVERIRQKKLAELEAAGVPEKYRADIKNLKFKSQ
ncbi:nasopharyngeal epithelium specific protein, putative [Trichomonas vaginalis G3]|uniref:Cilia- and flagella-associated protein 45 n=1 Tax=Trichomonas vaginalis (strain ATCC PRA-98 / G3) TaxID=412133 RepID=A2ETR1_TRIV3|nr:cilia- and flagella-associated protein 45 family [Trichomonas vaginalis G3]EAY03942.1 nasopharyngeal epithelium specific protein, putative [Trichomonas vaginalis G3]KAI5541038.1 cilia- and flagella-associated protein 45 family [Trichomonas vaginalis G3]|eukprot:XP_001316165.1 nasopharyngeal epithelium specific protein [Trichomonas vaginalis G3]